MSNVNVCACINSEEFSCQTTAVCEFHYCQGGKQQASGSTKMVLMLRYCTASGFSALPCGCSDIKRYLCGGGVL